MPLIRRPWEFQPPGATLLDPENTLAQGIVAGTLGSSPVYIGGTNSIAVSNSSFPPIHTSAGIGFRAVTTQQIARSVTTTSDLTLLIVGEVSSSADAQATFGGFTHNGSSDTFMIANGNGTTAGRITGRVYLGAYRTIGGSKTVPVGSTVVAVLRHRHNVAQELWVNGEKDASSSAFTGATVGNQYWGHYSAPSLWAPCALGLGWNRALSDDEITALSDNPWQVFEPRKIWVPFTAGGGGDINLTAAGSAQAATSSTGAISQSHALTGSNAGQAAASSTVAISQVHQLAGANSAQAATSSTGAISQIHQLAGANSTQAATSSTGAISLGVAINLAGAACAQASTSSAAAITQAHQLAAAACVQASTSSAGAITRVQQLVAAACAQANASSTGAISLGAISAPVAPAARIWVPPSELRVLTGLRESRTLKATP